MPIPTRQTANDILDTINQVKDMASQAKDRTKRRIRTGGSGGAQRPFVSTPFIGDTNGFGGQYDFPGAGGTFTPFTEAKVFQIVTPWNYVFTIPGTQLAVGFKFFADFISSKYIYTLKTFYIRVNGSYPNAGNVTNFDLFFARSSSSWELASTGTPGSLPVGSEATLETFDNANASNASRLYFSNKLFECSYDPVQNLFLIGHPVFGA